jgi:hypothetical protein
MMLRNHGTERAGEDKGKESGREAARNVGMNQRICRGHRSQSRPWCRSKCNQLMDSAAFMCFLVGTNLSASCLGVVKFM